MPIRANQPQSGKQQDAFDPSGNPVGSIDPATGNVILPGGGDVAPVPDFLGTWQLTRGRFLKEMEGLSQEQINWRLHPDALTIAEMGVHVAGTELSFCHQLLGKQPEGHDAALVKASTDGIVNDKPFPFSPEELTPAFVQASLKRSAEMAEAILQDPSEEIRARQVVSVLGPVIDGTGVMQRLSYHSGYHQGQVYLIPHRAGLSLSVSPTRRTRLRAQVEVALG